MAQDLKLTVVNAGGGLSCGECTACCDVMSIEDLSKPFYSRCKHLGACGCSIYVDPIRPKPCDCFRCAWLAGILGDNIDRRPDRSGLMFDLNPLNQPPVINVWEVIPGALNSDRVQLLLKKMREHKLIRGIKFGMPAVIFFPYGSKLGLRFDVSSEYPTWTTPIEPRLTLKRDPRLPPDQAIFAGEVAPLSMPQKAAPTPSCGTQNEL